MIEVENRDPDRVFQEQYWGAYDRSDVDRIYSLPLIKATLRDVAKLMADSAETALSDKTGTPLPKGTVLDLTNLEAMGAQNLPGTTLLIDHELLVPLSQIPGVPTPEPKRLEHPSLLTAPVRSLIKRRNDPHEDGRGITLRRGEVEFDNGAYSYRRFGRLGVVSALTDGKKCIAEVRSLKLRRRGNGIKATRPLNIRIVDSLFFRHEVGQTVWLPGGLLSRITSMEVLAAGEVAEAEDKLPTKSKRFAFAKRNAGN